MATVAGAAESATLHHQAPPLDPCAFWVPGGTVRTVSSTARAVAHGSLSPACRLAPFSPSTSFQPGRRGAVAALSAPDSTNNHDWRVEHPPLIDDSSSTPNVAAVRFPFTGRVPRRLPRSHCVPRSVFPGLVHIQRGRWPAAVQCELRLAITRPSIHVHRRERWLGTRIESCPPFGRFSPRGAAPAPPRPDRKISRLEPSLGAHVRPGTSGSSLCRAGHLADLQVLDSESSNDGLCGCWPSHRSPFADRLAFAHPGDGQPYLPADGSTRAGRERASAPDTAAPPPLAVQVSPTQQLTVDEPSATATPRRYQPRRHYRVPGWIVMAAKATCPRPARSTWSPDNELHPWRHRPRPANAPLRLGTQTSPTRREQAAHVTGLPRRPTCGILGSPRLSPRRAAWPDSADRSNAAIAPSKSLSACCAPWGTRGQAGSPPAPD